MGIRDFFDRPFSPGTRVRVLTDPEYGGPFAEECLGTVGSSTAAAGLTPAAARLSKYSYFVTFDTPQRDRDGDGPYSSSQVLSRYVVRA